MENFTRLIGHYLKRSFLQVFFPVIHPVIIARFHKAVQLFVGPVPPVLRIGNGDDGANILILAPHSPRYMAMQLGYTIGQVRKTQSRQGVIKLITVIPV